MAIGLRAVTLVGWLVVASGCGYKVAGTQRAEYPGVRTIGIVMLENRTPAVDIEQRLSRALIEGFATRSRWEVRDSAQGSDAVLRGQVLQVSAIPVTFGGTENFGSTFLVTVVASVTVTDARTQKVLFRNETLTFREEYVINLDVRNFFSERNPALDRIARDFAASVVASVIERF